MITLLLIIWYIALTAGFCTCLFIAFGASLWSDTAEAAKRWSERGALIMGVGIISIIAVSYFK